MDIPREECGNLLQYKEQTDVHCIQLEATWMADTIN